MQRSNDIQRVSRGPSQARVKDVDFLPPSNSAVRAVLDEAWRADSIARSRAREKQQWPAEVSLTCSKWNLDNDH